MATRPIIRWVGSKQRTLQRIVDALPGEHGTYHEPFVGSAAVLLGLAPPRARAADLNGELVNCYQQVVHDWRAVLSVARSYPSGKEAYYAVRALDRAPDFASLPPVERAARFVYLNRTSFQGLWRVSASTGCNNVPYGKRDATFSDEAFEAFAAALSGVKLSCCDFEEHLAEARAGDLAYLDPPYARAPGVSGFTAYTREGFDDSCQRRLLSCCDDLDRRGVMFVQSNSGCDLVRSMYARYRIEELEVRRTVAADASARGLAPEVIIMNY